MILDGSEIAINDSVFDVAFGSGHIIEINDKTKIFRVQFGPRTFSYNETGHGQFPRKTLFWRNPVGAFAPTKKDVNWDVFSRIRDAVAKELGYLE